MTGNTIICCVDDKNHYSREETRLLEKTVQDLEEETEQKNKHIQKLKYEHAKFLEEALKNERDLTKMIEEQQEIINEIQQQKMELEKIVADKIVESKDNTTQTSANITHKTADTQTENGKDGCTKEVGVNTEGLPSKVDKRNNSNDNLSKVITGTKKPLENVKKNNILILGDSNARDCAAILRKMCDINFLVTSFIKHNALLDQIVEDALNLTNGYGKEDYVIIMGGLTNTLKGVTVDQSVSAMLKNISEYTNVVVMTVPLWKNRIILNKFINEYNIRLHFELCVNNEKSDLLTYLNVNAILSNKSFYVIRKRLLMKYYGKVRLMKYIKMLIYKQLTEKEQKIIYYTKISTQLSQNLPENHKFMGPTENSIDVNEVSEDLCETPINIDQNGVSLMTELKEAHEQEKLNTVSFFGTGRQGKEKC